MAGISTVLFILSNSIYLSRQLSAFYNLTISRMPFFKRRIWVILLWEFLLFLELLKVEPRASHTIDKCYSNELNHHHFFNPLFFQLKWQISVWKSFTKYHLVVKCYLSLYLLTIIQYVIVMVNLSIGGDCLTVVTCIYCLILIWIFVTQQVL